MYQSNLINDYLDTLFLCYSNLKYFIYIFALKFIILHTYV